MASENYLDIDFNTFIEKMKEVLQNSETFKDYNYEGSNISVLIELLAYQMELNTYYQNQIAKNLFIDTANLYSTMHRLANLLGYDASGYIAAYASLTLEVSGGFDPGDQLYIPAYTEFTTEDGTTFVNTISYNFTVPLTASGAYTMEIGVKQGTRTQLTYIGSDLVDFELYLPNRQFDHDDNLTNSQKSIRVYINDEEWTRVGNFYEDFSELENVNNVYTFKYDKNQNYILTFSPSRNYPHNVDDIEIDLVETQGIAGSAGANTITSANEAFLSNITQGSTISLDNISITNPDATRNAANPETTDEVRDNSRTNINTQFRLVTKNDFKTYLETRNDIDAAWVWGEKEINPKGDTQEYNQIYISVIPNEWLDSTITTSTSAWEPVAGKTVDIIVPESFNAIYRESISEFMEPRKGFNLFENYVVPELIYFYFDIGMVVKRNYNLTSVVNDVKDKLVYYFSNENRNFNETIDFRDIEDFVKDTGEVSQTDNFPQVAGIKYFTFRDIVVSHYVYDYETSSYPQYYYSEFDSYIDNILRPIKLGQNQFPKVNKDTIVIRNEG